VEVSSQRQRSCARDRRVLLSHCQHGPRVTGTETIVSNANFTPAPSSELDLAGYLWGTFHIENEGGAWDGTFTSEITGGCEYFYRGVAHGSGGYEGLVGHWEAYRNGHSGPFTLSGWILEP
jgi:hypothetical protein